MIEIDRSQLTAYGAFNDQLSNDPLKDVPTNSIQYKTEEVGQSGTLNYSGFLDTEEWIGELKGYPLYKTIDYMRTDAVLSAVEKGYFYPIEQGTITFDYERKELAEDPKYQAILKFIQSDFTRIDYQSFLHNANLFIPYGFSIFEQIYEMRKDGYLHLKKLAPRLPKTAWKWLIDGHGNLKTLVQLVYTPQPDGANGAWKYIPIMFDKLLVITNLKEGGNFAGRSEFRPLYREWRIKDNALKQMIIAINRVGGGVPIAIINKDAPNTSDDGNISVVSQVEKMLQKLQGSESAYMVGKYLDKLELLTLPPDALTTLQNLVRYCDEAMAKSAFQLWMNLGSGGASGNRALGQTFEGLYYQALEEKVSIICSAVNEQVIKRLIDYNFGPQEYYPIMKIQIKQDLSAISNVLAVLKTSGVIKGNTDLENYVLAEWGLPLTENNNKIEQTYQSAQMCEHTEKGHLDLSEARRKPSKVESSIINLADIVGGLKTLETNLAQELRRIAEPAMLEMAKKLVEGQKVYQIRPEWGIKVSDLYKKYYRKLLYQGRDDIRREITRQKKGNINLSEKKKIEKEDKYLKFVDEQANLDSDLLSNEVKTAVVKYFAVGKAKGLKGDDLLGFIFGSIEEEKGQRYEQAASQFTGFYGQVREIASEEFTSVVKSKIRSEILDQNICETCRDQDGQEYFYDKSTDEYYDKNGMPAPSAPFQDCIGTQYGNACRGMYIYTIE